MYFFQRNKFKLIIAAVTIVLVFILAASTVGVGKIPIVSSVVTVVTTPVQKLINGVTSGVGGFFATIGSNKNYARENDELRKQIASLENKIRENDALIITADHGCDPDFKGTDHTRECVPFILYGNSIEPENLGTIEGYDYISKVVKEILIKE